MATANPTDTSGIVGDDFLSWPVSAQRAELDRLQHILDRTRESLNLDGTHDDSSFEDRDRWDQATPEPFSASTPIISGGVEDDGQRMPDLTPITPFSAGLYTGQGHGAYGHGAPPVSFSVERHAERGFRGIAQGLPPVARVSTSVTQTTPVFSYSRPLPSPSAHSRSQRRVSFAPVTWDTTSGSKDMEATSVYGGIWLPSGIPSHEGIVPLFLLLELRISPVATKPYHRHRRSHRSPCPDQVYRADFRVHWDVERTSLLALMLLDSSHLWHKVMWVILRVGIKVSTNQNSKHGRVMSNCKGKHMLVIFIQMMARQARWTTIFMGMLEWCHPGLHMMMLLSMDQDMVSVMVSFVNPKHMSGSWGWMSICLSMSVKMCLLHFQIMV